MILNTLTRYDFLNEPTRWNIEEIQELISFCEKDIQKRNISNSGLIFECIEEREHWKKLDKKIIELGKKVIKWKIQKKT